MGDHREGDASEKNAARERPSGSGSKKSSGPDPLIGRVINGRYKIVSLVARGGMGKVYKAEQQPLGRTCALKVLNPRYEGDRDPEFGKRFFLEAATAAKLTHPNTVTIFDYGSSDEGDIYYIAMEFIEGKTLHRVLREETFLPEARASHIARQVCRSLREAHELGVVHRDLKPGNILLTNRGDEQDVVKVLDFGLVKDVTGDAEDLTQQGLFMGSPKYMAPEQITGGEISARTDIYSLGVMLYEMLTGKVPFDRGASVNTLMAHVNDAPPPLTQMNPNAVVSVQMAEIIARCLEKDAAKRFGSMNELLASLKRTGNASITDTHDALPAAVLAQYGSAARLSGPDAPSSTSIPIPVGLKSAPELSPDAAHSEPGSIPSRTPAPFNSDKDPSHTDLQAGMPSLVNLSLQKKRRATSVIVVVGLAATIAAVAFLLMRKPPGPDPNGASGQTDGTTSATATTAPQGPGSSTATASTSMTATATTSAAPAARVVRIESEPSGATVSEDGKELCAATPCDVTFSDAAPKDHKVSVVKKGYKTGSLVVAAAETKSSIKLDAAAMFMGPGPAAPGPSQPHFDACLDDTDCKGGRKCLHGYCK